MYERLDEHGENVLMVFPWGTEGRGFRPDVEELERIRDENAREAKAFRWKYQSRA
jgi:hypothetical protein